VDDGVIEGGDVPVAYDPLLAKLIVHAENRPAAIERTIAALRHYAVLGIRTNVPFLLRVLRHDAFAAGGIHTGFIDEHLTTLTAPRAPGAELVAAAATARTATAARPAIHAAAGGSSGHPDPWETLHGWGR
jgi:acetyl/propionyl-CoA carboxylase alpha subunit